jgi:hypothetical protein
LVLVVREVLTLKLAGLVTILFLVRLHRLAAVGVVIIQLVPHYLVVLEVVVLDFHLILVALVQLTKVTLVVMAFLGLIMALVAVAVLVR